MSRAALKGFWYEDLDVESVGVAEKAPDARKVVCVYSPFLLEVLMQY